LVRLPEAGVGNEIKINPFFSSPPRKSSQGHVQRWDEDADRLPKDASSTALPRFLRDVLFRGAVVQSHIMSGVSLFFRRLFSLCSNFSPRRSSLFPERSISFRHDSPGGLSLFFICHKDLSDLSRSNAPRRLAPSCLARDEWYLFVEVLLELFDAANALSLRYSALTTRALSPPHQLVQVP